MKYATLKSGLATGLAATLLATNVFAKDTADDIVLADFKTVNTRQLDTAEVNPKFNPNDFETVVIQWGEFDYRPGAEKYRHWMTDDNYNYKPAQKVRLVEQAQYEFIKQFEALENYKLIDIKDSTDKTLFVYLNLTDVVSYVPDNSDVPGLQEIYMRDFGKATLNVEFLDGANGELLFKGDVNNTIGASGFDFERATQIAAWQRTKMKLRHWAKGMRKGIDGMK